MQPLVSVIVPVYKAEKYLDRCLDSLCRQSLENIEILLIDDASPDRCGEICEQYAAKDRRCKVIHNTMNKGVSAVRNIGIENAAGEYLMFADSDDWVHEDFCKDAYECAVHNQADLVMFGYQQIIMDNNSVIDGHYSFLATVREGHKTREEAIDMAIITIGMVPWNKLYHKSLFKGIYYPEGEIFEDTATSYKIIWKASRIYCIDKVLYYYYRHSESLTIQKISQKASQKRIRAQYNVYRQMFYDLSEWGFHSERFDLYKKRCALDYCMQAPMDFSDPCYMYFGSVLRNIQKMPESFTWRKKLLVKIFQVNPKLFDLICLLWNKHKL